MSLRRRVTAVIAGMAGLALVLSGCLYAQIPPMAPDTERSLAPQTDGIEASLLPYYGQTLNVETAAASASTARRSPPPATTRIRLPVTCSWP